jgi:hypothetical protein
VASLKKRLDRLQPATVPVHFIVLDRPDETLEEALARRPAPDRARVMLVDTGIYRSDADCKEDKSASPTARL